MTVGPEKGMTERESGVVCWPCVLKREAVIMSGSRETTVKERDGGACDKSCNGNACHIDEATPREVGNGGHLHIPSPSNSARGS